MELVCTFLLPKRLLFCQLLMYGGAILHQKLAKEYNALDRRIGGFGYYISYGSSLIVVIPPEYTTATRVRSYMIGNEMFRILEKERRRINTD